MSCTVSERLRVEVVLALPEEALVVTLEVPHGTTVRNAVERSRLGERMPGLDLAAARFGVFGRRCAPDALLVDGDRVEIYRELGADPKAIRKRRAAAARGAGTQR